MGQFSHIKREIELYFYFILFFTPEEEEHELFFKLQNQLKASKIITGSILFAKCMFYRTQANWYTKMF